ncbi:MAG: hypothetical protein M3Z64_01595, partial [Verrucomicrobiota bacterium]|nr:hypothetical protein [Verrucomicrobiota bacterium]
MSGPNERSLRIGPFTVNAPTHQTCPFVAIALALVHWILAVSAVGTKSPTFDEPTHFAAGYSYWLRHDFRLDPESGNLPQRWA